MDAKYRRGQGGFSQGARATCYPPTLYAFRREEQTSSLTAAFERVPDVETHEKSVSREPVVREPVVENTENWWVPPIFFSTRLSAKSRS